MGKVALKSRPILAQNIILRRKAMGFSQIELAERVGVHLNIIKKLESGRGEGEMQNREAIAQALECSLSDLYMTPESKPKPINEVSFVNWRSPEQWLPGALVLERLASVQIERRFAVLFLLFDEPLYRNREMLPPALDSLARALKKLPLKPE